MVSSDGKAGGDAKTAGSAPAGVIREDDSGAGGAGSGAGAGAGGMGGLKPTGLGAVGGAGEEADSDAEDEGNAEPLWKSEGKDNNKADMGMCSAPLCSALLCSVQCNVKLMPYVM